MRDTLNPEVLRVMGPRGLLCEVWLRKTVPAAAAATDEPDVKMTRIAEGTLFGAMRLPATPRISASKPFTPACTRCATSGSR